MLHSLTLILILNRLRFCLVALVNFVLVAFWTPNLGGILTKKILKKNHFGHHIFLLWTFLIKMLTTDFLTGFLTLNMRFFDISASEVDSKNRSKKNSFFYFLSWSTSRQVAVIHKAIRQLPASINSREKSLCGCVILTGSFGPKYVLF